MQFGEKNRMAEYPFVPLTTYHEYSPIGKKPLGEIATFL
jgi:hypothetical protein